MVNIACEDCHEQILMGASLRKPIESNQYIFCKKCLKQKEICSAITSKQIFFLEDDDFKNLKSIYIDNPKNKNRFFIFSDVNDYVIKKYGSIENLEQIRQNKLKNSKVHLEREKRKTILLDAIENNKLEYKNYGDCFSYVKYGTPSIETVIGNELEKLEAKRKRKISLANELAKLGISLDEDLPSCYNYINKIGCKTLIETIREIEIEHYFKNNSSYLQYLENFDPMKAKQLARTEIKQNTKIKFE